MLFLAVIVYGNAAAAHVYAAANITVTNIGKMWQLGANAYVGVFNLYKVADFYIIADNGIGTQMYIGTSSYMVANLAVMTIGKLDMSIVAYFYVSKAYVRTDFTILTNNGVALEPGVGIDNGVTADFYAAFDKGAGRIHNGYACIHKLV